VYRKGGGVVHCMPTCLHTVGITKCLPASLAHKGPGSGNKRTYYKPVLLILIRPRMFLGLTDPDPLVKGTDPAPGPSIIKQKWKKTLDYYY
jgi:hypothetical protein